jgi:hypothetical protein
MLWRLTHATQFLGYGTDRVRTKHGGNLPVHKAEHETLTDQMINANLTIHCRRTMLAMACEINDADRLIPVPWKPFTFIRFLQDVQNLTALEHPNFGPQGYSTGSKANQSSFLSGRGCGIEETSSIQSFVIQLLSAPGVHF